MVLAEMTRQQARNHVVGADEMVLEQMQQYEIPLSNTCCGACGCEPAWLWPNGDTLCASCFHNGETPNQVKREIRANIKKVRQHPERDFQNQIIDLLRLHGFKVAHFGVGMMRIKGKMQWACPAGADGQGWPDIVAIHPSGKGVAWELKASRAGMKAIPAEQTTWLDLFHEAGFHSHVWIPSDWDEIVRILEAMELRISGRCLNQ